MKLPLSACLAALFLAFTPLPSSAQADAPDWTALPADTAALEELDQQQLRALRGSVRACNDLARADHSGVPCVFLDLDRVMRQDENAALRAYHFALPRSYRYDDARNRGAAVERVLKARNEALPDER